MNTNIDWNYPQPRSGFSGAMDKFIGPGATRPEIIIGMGASILAPLAVVIYAYLVQLGWDAVQYVIAGLLASDIVGGIAVDTTSSAKRWYHREGQGTRQLFGKVAYHLVHIFLVAWLFRNFDLVYFMVVSGYLIAATFLILGLPLYLRRSAAALLVCGAMVLNMYSFPMTLGLEWFIPFLFIGLLFSFILREEPYRPQKEI
jgi:hypothetical protein